MADRSGTLQFHADVMENNPPSIWHLMGQRAKEIVSQALDQASAGVALGAETMTNLTTRVTELLQSPLDHLAAWHNNGIGNMSMNDEVDGAVSGVVHQAFHDLNITDTSTNSSNLEQKFVKILDREIELDMMNKVFSNVSRKIEQRESDFFHNMPIEDETMFVAVLCMAIIMPIIFITLFVIFLYKKRKDNVERSQEMLLQNQPEFHMDEYNGGRTEGSSPKDDNDVPDLVLKNYTV